MAQSGHQPRISRSTSHTSARIRQLSASTRDPGPRRSDHRAARSIQNLRRPGPQRISRLPHAPDLAALTASPHGSWGRRSCASMSHTIISGRRSRAPRVADSTLGRDAPTTTSHVPDRARPGCALTYIPRCAGAAFAAPRGPSDAGRGASRARAAWSASARCRERHSQLVA